ncbi:HAD-IA family hydrolase [Catellatospora sp. NPDC049609]|uniref:HAD family hydrolase n=1 Tax=Catellatospora sp. NPDC049609 TaxID=3155505 RepID=UPI00342ECF59
MVRTLLLDVDGVLLFPDPAFAAEMERRHHWHLGYQAFQDDLLHDPGEERALVGDGDMLAVVARALARHTTGVTAEPFFTEWLEAAVTVNTELLDLLPHMAVDEVYLATNQEPRRAEMIRRRFADRPEIAGLLVSHEFGHMKPDPLFFAKALARIGRTAAECVFVDDKPAYVAGGRAAGIDTIWYTGNARLTAELADRGLLR